MRTSIFTLVVCALISVAFTAHAQYWCLDLDEIVAEVDGSQVHIQHLADFINCCPDPITYDIQVGDAAILVEEQSDAGCYCLCCFV